MSPRAAWTHSSRMRPEASRLGAAASRAGGPANLLGLILAVLLGALALPARAAELQVRFQDGRPPVALQLERVDDTSDELFVSANDLAPALLLERFWKPETRKLVLKFEAHKIQVTVDARLVLDNDQDLLLRVPVRYRQGGVMLPLEFLERVLVPAMGGTIQFDRAGLVLVAGSSARSDVTSVDYDVSPGATQVRVHLTRAFRYRVEATSHEIIRVTVFEAHIDAVSLTADHPTPLVRTLRAEQRPNQAVLYLEVAQGSEGFESSSSDDGRTVLLTLKRASERTPAPDFRLPHVAQAAERPRDADSLDVIVLDAGHGGYDHGVQVPGHDEKDVTLALAQQLEPLLERDLHVKVVLVRDTDRAITPERRAEIANRAHGDLLISLHCNGWYDAHTGGFETLSAAPEPAPREDAAPGGEGARAQASRLPAATGTPSAEAARGAGSATTANDFRPWYTAQAPFVERSQTLAQLLQSELGRRLTLANRGARQADVEVLKGMAMPAVLLEVGFLTNPGEVETITGGEFVNDLEAGIVAALQRLKEQSAPAGAGSPGTTP